ncbi:MAG: hypothetical protein E6J90_03325 [Deltaproteobacteria bacterium]|nr:MAG: hypothetical protein E6J91_16590 [Deltaproteobacteria bacterium]TMQ27056.1 MAG: hypothetical protein E6J90_03325 [Deltaproteobacteria bacterium]
MVDIADWGRPEPFGAAAIATYRSGDELVDDLLDAVARRLDGDPGGFDAVGYRLAATPALTAPLLVRAFQRLPLDPLATQILGFALAWELSPTLHRRLDALDIEALIAWCDLPSPRAVGRALHPAGPLVGFELVAVGDTGPWFAHTVRATPAACRLATAPDPADEPALPALGAPDPRLVDIFAAPGPSTTLVRGDRALDAVLAAAAEAGASPCVGGTPERSLAAAIRDACLTDRMPVLVCERADLVDRGLLARVAGPRCLVLAGTGPLEMVTQPG